MVTRLRQLWLTSSATAPTVLVYGDLKPEHVMFEDGATAKGRPVLIDPGLLRAQATVDAAKLISRTMLLLISSYPDPVTTDGLAAGLVVFVDDQLQAMTAVTRQSWTAELVLLWLMDTVNILTTYLSAPAGLPLPGHAAAALSVAGRLWALADNLSAALAAGIDPYAVWRMGLAEAAYHRPEVLP